MATNLTTIEVRLIANAQKFKKDVDQAKKKTKECQRDDLDMDVEEDLPPRHLLPVYNVKMKEIYQLLNF